MDWINSNKKVVIPIAIFFIGSICGYHIGIASLAKTVTGTSAFSFFITRPLFTYVAINNKLYSQNPVERLTGYCTLYDLHIIDSDFLYERYKQEDSIVNKRMILQILALKGSRDFYNFLDEMYELSDTSLKMYMVNIIKKQYPDKLLKFAQKHNVDVQWIHNDI